MEKIGEVLELVFATIAVLIVTTLFYLILSFIALVVIRVDIPTNYNEPSYFDNINR